MESTLREAAPDDLRVIETLRIDPEAGPCRLPLHVARMAATCARLGIPFDRAVCEAQVAQITADAPQRCRITADREGHIEVAAAALAPAPAPERWRVAIHATRLESIDPWLRVKTTKRRLYDDARAALPDGIDEWLFANERGEVCEGTITNVFVRQNGKLLTPALECGLLPGVLRAELLQRGETEEAVIGLGDLARAEAIFVGNSLRGLIPAVLVGP